MSDVALHPMERVERDAWITKLEFHRRLEDWYRESRAPLIGDPGVPGMTGWVFVRDGHMLAKLHADTTRAGVGEYLALLRSQRGELPWYVVESARGQPTKVAFGAERRIIPGFYLYLYTLGA
jgi:hypothetical protein